MMKMMMMRISTARDIGTSALINGTDGFCPTFGGNV